MPNRREFLGGSAALLAASASGARIEPGEADDSLNILFLGGTGFIGPHQIEYALARGHKVSMFNRGRRSGLYGGRVEELTGNRDSQVDDGLSALEGNRTWDVVVDNSGYIPRHVRDSAELLKDRCGRYIYVSTVAVYDFEKTPVIDINSPMHAAPEPETEQVTGETYGPLKAECDRIAADILGDKYTSVRPTYIIGPGDTTDRFTYWVDRFQRGGEIVCPSAPELASAWVDVFDLCHWLVELGERDQAGIFNAVTPDERVTREQVMHGIKATTAAASTLYWPEDENLEAAGFAPPMFPTGQVDRLMDSSHAKRAGLRKTPLAESVQAIAAWWATVPPERKQSVRRWPTPEQEALVLKSIKES